MSESSKQTMRELSAEEVGIVGGGAPRLGILGKNFKKVLELFRKLRNRR